jgi:hypothetical protein
MKIKEDLVARSLIVGGLSTPFRHVFAGVMVLSAVVHLDSLEGGEPHLRRLSAPARTAPRWPQPPRAKQFSLPELQDPSPRRLIQRHRACSESRPSSTPNRTFLGKLLIRWPRRLRSGILISLAAFFDLLAQLGDRCADTFPTFEKAAELER